MGKIFELPTHIYFVEKLGGEFQDGIPLSGWVEGDLKTGVTAFFLAVSQNEVGTGEKVNFRIPIDDLEIMHVCCGNTQLEYVGNDAELLSALRENVDKIDFEKACILEFNS